MYLYHCIDSNIIMQEGVWVCVYIIGVSTSETHAYQWMNLCETGNKRQCMDLCVSIIITICLWRVRVYACMHAHLTCSALNLTS